MFTYPAITASQLIFSGYIVEYEYKSIYLLGYCPIQNYTDQ